MTTTPAHAFTEPVRPCPTCATPMERHGRSWLCPRQRDEEKVVSQAMQAQVLDTAAKRVHGLPF